MIKNTLLSLIQKEFPLVQRPFAKLGKKIGISEEDVLSILNEEKEKSIIRQISPIFDTKKLGYKSSLVAFMVNYDDIDQAVKYINSHPGVSHNYERNHDFNIWFTIAVPSDGKLSLEESVKILAKLSNAKDYIILPTLKMFKIQVKLDTTGKESKKEKIVKKEHKNITLTDFHKKIIQKSQYDIPIVSEPFEHIINDLNIDYQKFFDTLNELKNSGVMRRFAAILNHRKAGFNANAMVVWDIDEKNAQEIGKIAASFSAVSHCYLRPKYPNWPYNLFTMIHGKTNQETNSVIDDIAKEIIFKDKMPLYSTKEFKKQRLIYYTRDFEDWGKNYLQNSLI